MTPRLGRLTALDRDEDARVEGPTLVQRVIIFSLKGWSRNCHNGFWTRVGPRVVLVFGCVFG